MMPVEQMCRMIAVSVSGYHAWKEHKPSLHQCYDVVLSSNIRAQFASSNQSYGAPHMQAELCEEGLALKALTQAILIRQPPAGVIHHSDRGSHYASNDYRRRLADHDIAVPMSRPGNPYYYAKAESFLKTLKYEELNARSITSITNARTHIDDFISNIYYSERLHSALG